MDGDGTFWFSTEGAIPRAPVFQAEPHLTHMCSAAAFFPACSLAAK